MKASKLMKTQQLSIAGIPAILWGPISDNLIIAVHGDQSNKADVTIKILSEETVPNDYCVLSFDLPEHGDRKEEPRLCKVQNCIEDLEIVIKYARTISDTICLFGCSIGAYFSMLAFKDEPIKLALFLSPVIDMKRIINNIMTWFDVSEERLEAEQEVVTPVKTLYWDYYRYVLEHPVEWNKPTALLYGAKDNLCELDYVNDFAERTHAKMTVMEEGEHFFHTDTQLAFFRKWLRDSIAV